MTFQGILAACFSQLVYHFVLPKSRTSTAYMIGYGFIIPFWLLFPSAVIDYLDVRNKVFRFCIAAVTPSLCVFRTTEGRDFVVIFVCQCLVFWAPPFLRTNVLIMLLNLAPSGLLLSKKRCMVFHQSMLCSQLKPTQYILACQWLQSMIRVPRNM